MIELRIGKHVIPDCSVEDFVSTAGSLGISNEATLLAELGKFVGKLHEIPFVDAVGFTMVKQRPAPDTLAISVLLPLERGNERATQALRDVTVADGQLARTTLGIMPMSLGFFNSRKINASKMWTILGGNDTSEEFIGMAVFKR